MELLRTHEPLEAFVFDMDGTLLDSLPAHAFRLPHAHHRGNLGHDRQRLAFAYSASAAAKPE